MGKTAIPDIKFAKNFFNYWQSNGGLVKQSEAARILNITDASMNRLAKERKIHKIKIDDSAYVAYSDLYNIYTERSKKVS